MLPIVLFLMANNRYAKAVVLDKVSETYRNTLDIFVEQNDRLLREIGDYLNNKAILDIDINQWTSYPYGSDDHMLTKIRIQNKINNDKEFYNRIDTIFVFNPGSGELLLSSHSRYETIRAVLTERLAEGNLLPDGRWQLVSDGRIRGKDYLIATAAASNGLSIGAIIKVADILDLLAIQWNRGDIGDGAIYDRAGNLLGTAEGASAAGRFGGAAAVLNDRLPYQFMTDATTGKRYLVMSRSSEVSGLTMSILVPEDFLLQGLPYFQRVTYFLVAGIVVIFAAYLIFIRHALFKPLQLLIAGMKKISLGMLDVRLQTNDTVEFVFLANTFNTMVSQIKGLRIGMYEEQLRAQQIELRQLQAQINPHFYMNSLNIIYNLAVLKDNDSVKKMALHLGDYFRFIMKSSGDTIALEHELGHIRNYMAIQKLRFPGKLEFHDRIPEELRVIPLPALTVQPFIENAIIHGFVNHRLPFEVSVEGSLVETADGTLLAITVRDTGKGFQPEVLERLNRGDWLPEGQTSRLGIQNVVQRLQLHYGGAAGVYFAAGGEGGGAAVTIRLPLMRKTKPSEEERDVQLAGG